MHSTIQKLGSALKDLESRIILDSIYASDEDILFLRHSRKSIASLDDELLGSIRTSLLSRNTAERGIISWLNAGVSRNINPEPIHLRQTIQYLIANAKFDRTGYDIFEIDAAPNDAVRYALIETRLRANAAGKSDRHDKISHGELVTDKMKSMWQRFFQGEAYDDRPADTTLQSSINDIVQVAKKVFIDIFKSRMYATSGTGKGCSK